MSPLLDACLILLFFTSTVHSWCANSSRFVSKEVVVDSEVEYWQDSGLRILLSVPHGGHLRPENVLMRTAGCWDEQNGKCIWSHGCGVEDATRCTAVSDMDMYTAELTREVRENLCCIFAGLCPSVVISLLDRNRHDPNRPFDEATFEVSRVVESFNRYHNAITDMGNKFQQKSTYGGLLIDMHGHAHPIERAELGYLYTSRQLDSGDYLDPALSSLAQLASRSNSFESLLRGNTSFGRYLENYGFQAVPSPNASGPAGAAYFSGGFTVQRHSSRDGGRFDVIQVESPQSYRKADTRTRYACAVAFAAADFYCEHYVNASRPGCLPEAIKQRTLRQCITRSSAHTLVQAMSTFFIATSIISIYIYNNIFII